MPHPSPLFLPITIQPPPPKLISSTRPPKIATAPPQEPVVPDKHHHRTNDVAREREGEGEPGIPNRGIGCAAADAAEPDGARREGIVGQQHREPAGAGCGGVAGRGEGDREEEGGRGDDDRGDTLGSLGGYCYCCSQSGGIVVREETRTIMGGVTGRARRGIGSLCTPPPSFFLASCVGSLAEVVEKVARWRLLGEIFTRSQEIYLNQASTKRKTKSLCTRNRLQL